MERRAALARLAAAAGGGWFLDPAWSADGRKSPRGLWAPTDFPISFWCGPPEPYVTLDQYQRIARSGFNYVMPPCSGAMRETNLKALALAKRAGLRVFVSDGRIPMSMPSGSEGRAALDAVVADYSRQPALAGYFLADEPGAGAFSGLAAVVSYLREKDPEHPVYINLFPNYAPPAALGVPTYDEYVDRYIETVRPFVVSYDHYHFLKSGDRPTFFSNLESVRRISRRQGVPFWQIVLATQHGGYRELSEAEKRWEAMQTLAYGGKGLLYFTYWTPDSSSQWGEAIIHADGTPGAQYEHVRRINHDVRAIGRWLLEAESRLVFQTGAVPAGGTAAPAEAPVRTVMPVDLTIGTFHAADRNLALVANGDYRREQLTDLRIATSGRKLERLDTVTGRWIRAGTRNPYDVYVGDLRLRAGAAELFRW